MNSDFEAELAAKARNGDPSAAPFLVSCFGERLLGYARGHAPDLSDADRERIVELAIEAGVRAIDRFDPSRGSLESWFRGQIRFQTLGWRRRVPQHAELHDQLPAATHTDDQPSTHPQAVAALRQAISHLKYDDQMILALRNAEQLTFGEIAQRLKIPEDTARQRHHRAFQRLRTQVAAEPGLAELVTENGT